MEDYLVTVYDNFRSENIGLNPTVYVDAPTPVKSATLTVLSDVTNGNHKNPNTHSYRKTKIVFPQGTLKRKPDEFNEYKASGSLSTVILPQFAETAGDNVRKSTVREKCISKFYERLKQSNLNLAISVAESKQTKKMLGTAVDGVIGFARAARRKALRRYISRPNQGWDNAMANAWLSYQYGWRPLLNDIYEIHKFQRTSCRRLKVSARTSDPIVSKVDQIFWSPLRNHVHDSARYEISCIVQVSDPSLFDTTRYTSLNPLAIAWELVPYSFVIDWFIDIGGYMENLEQALGAGLDFVQGFETFTHRVQTSLEQTGGFCVNSPDIPWEVQGTLYASCIDSFKNREPIASLPLPALPSFKVSLGKERLLSAISLLTQIFRKP